MVLPPAKPTLLDAAINKINLLAVQKNIKKYSPTPKKVQIVAVTKTLSFKAIQSAFNNKIFLIGESKIQETQQKTHKKLINKEAQFHLIGHLQSNKTKKAVKLYDTIETVDTEKILNKIV